MIRILLVDDQALLCEVLKTWLEVEKDFEVVGIANNGEEAIEKVELLRPDIVLIDIEMPGMNGLNATTIIGQRFPEVKVIVLSAHDDDAYIGKSVRAGAKGYVLKNTTAEELANKIRAIYSSSEQMIDEGIYHPTTDLQALKEEIMQEILIYQHQLEANLAKARENNGDVGKVKEYLQQNLATLQKTTEDDLNQLRSELLNTQNTLGDMNRSYTTTQINQHLVNLKKELEEQLAVTVERWSQERTALQEWAVQREEMYPSTEEIELKFRNELMAVINPMRTSIRDLSKQVRFLRSFMFALMFISAIALTFAGWAFVSSSSSDSSSSTDAEQSTTQN
jgi:DNA-binding NarL/FixJ family response regulator